MNNKKNQQFPNFFDKDTKKQILTDMPRAHKILFAIILLIALIIVALATNHFSDKPMLDETGNLVIFVFSCVIIILILVLLFVILIKGDPYESKKELIEDEADVQDKGKMEKWMLKIENKILKSSDLNVEALDLVKNSMDELRRIKGIDPNDVHQLTTEAYLTTIFNLIKEKKIKKDITRAVKTIQTFHLGVSSIKK
ncbi:hypothetical protein JXB41_07140 [Candidatus Woesearchaeota archaeon]|nr:hypothetical protein [Candidatus Woesearchaeota archaeon]